MATSNTSLWQIVRLLEAQAPFRKAAVDSVLGGLTLVDQDDDAPWAFFVGGPLALSDGCIIAKIDLRLRKARGSPSSFLVLYIEGAAVILPQVEQHYSNLKITQTPRGHSLDEQTAYSTKRPWGNLGFGFKERRPDCLASIAFDPTK